MIARDDGKQQMIKRRTLACLFHSSWCRKSVLQDFDVEVGRKKELAKHNLTTC